MGAQREVTNAISFMKSLEGLEKAEDDGKDSSKAASAGRGEASVRVRRGTSKLQAGGDGAGGGGAPSEDANNGAAFNLQTNFFVKSADARYSMTSASASSEAAAISRQELQSQLVDAKRYLARQAEVFVLVMGSLGLYDLLCSYYSAVKGLDGTSHLTALLLTRYCGFLPVCCTRVPEPLAGWRALVSPDCSRSRCSEPCVSAGAAAASVFHRLCRRVPDEAAHPDRVHLPHHHPHRRPPR